VLRKTNLEVIGHLTEEHNPEWRDLFDDIA